MALRFVGGDDVIEPFLLRHTDGTIVDLTHMRPLTGGVWWRGKQRFALTIGAGITINSQSPPDVAPQEPHGFVTLTKDQTDDIPFGEIASIRIFALSLVEGNKMSTYLSSLERIT